MGIEWVDEDTLARREKAIKRWTREREQLCYEFGLTVLEIEDYKDYCQNLFRELISKGFAS